MKPTADTQDWPVILVNQASGARLSLPGIYQGANVARPLRIDEAATEGKSGKRRQAQGFEDADMTINLLLVDDETGTALDKLARIEEFRSALDATGKPPVYKIISPHAEARKIREIHWLDLRSYDTNQDMSFPVDLVFTEQSPAVALAEDRAAPAANAGIDPAVSATFGVEDTIPVYYFEGW